MGSRRGHRLDDIGDRIADMLDLKVPSGIMGKLAMLPKLAEMAKFPPRTRSGRAPCQQVVLRGNEIDLDRIPMLQTWPDDGGRYLTLPMLKPVILFTTVISTIGTLQLFDEPYNITQGGPSQATLTLSYYIYDLTFRFMPSFGYSATVSWVIVVLVGILTFIQFLVAREDRRA